MIRNALASLRRDAPHQAIVAFGIAAFLGVRLAHPVQELGNPDIAGILYSADVIVHGGLPYVDTVDLKSPAPFFLLAGVFRLISREFWAVQLAYAIWILLAGPAMWIAARALYGTTRAGKIASAAAVALYLPTAAAFDLNYSEWMATPYVWAFALTLHAVRFGGLGVHLAAGALAAVAFAFKHHAVVLGPAMVGLWGWARWRKHPGAVWWAPLAWGAGALLGFAPLAIPYAARGALPALVHGLIPLGEAARYGSAVVATDPPYVLIHRVPLQQLRAFPLQIAASAASLLGVVLAFRARKTEALSTSTPEPSVAPEASSPFAPQAVFYLLSIVACGLGGLRFFTHYLVQCLAGIALLAAHPAAWLWLTAPRNLVRPKALYVLTRVHLLGLFGLLAVLVGSIPLGHAVLVDNRGAATIAEAGRYIRERTTPDDTIVVWGWAAWGVHYYADRRSPSRIFKMIGQVTTYNDNSRLSRGRSLEFVPGPLADELVRDVREKRPAFIVRANPFFPWTNRDPMESFTELRKILRTEYQLVKSFGKTQLYERVDRIDPSKRSINLRMPVRSRLPK
jgi:hypothetical protein